MAIKCKKNYYKKWIKYFIIFDYFYFFILRRLNFESFVFNYLKSFVLFPIEFCTFQNSQQANKYIGLDVNKNLNSAVYLDFLTITSLGITTGQLYEFEFKFDILGNGEWRNVKRIAILKCLNSFYRIQNNRKIIAFTSKQLAFNIFQQQGFIKEKKLKGINCLQNSNIPTALIIKIALIKYSTVSCRVMFISIHNKESMLHEYFNEKRLFYVGDVISIGEDANSSQIFSFKIISLISSSTIDNQTIDIPFAFVDNKSTTCIELPLIENVKYLHERINWDVEFISMAVKETVKNMCEFFTRAFFQRNCICNQEFFNVYKCKSHMCNASLSSIPTCVISFSTLGTCRVLINYFEDEMYVNVYEVNCLNFSTEVIGYSAQSASGRKMLEERIRKTILLAESFMPCVILLKNITIVFGEGKSNSDFALKILLEAIQNLGKQKKPNNNSGNTKNDKRSYKKQIGLILACKSDEFSDIPQGLGKLIHFDFYVGDLTIQDKKKFFVLKIKNRLNWLQDDDEQWFLDLTKSFSLPELNQLLSVADENALSNAIKDECKKWQSAEILRSHFNLAIDKRQKAQNDIAGVSKIPNVTWEDVGGLESIKQLITESLQMNLHDINDGQSSSWRRFGILMYGPPGCGKTMIAKAVANEFKMTFLSVKGPELLNQYVGQSEKNLRDVFAKARSGAPSILFFDELDSLASTRGSTGDSGGVMDRMVSQLLSELDLIQYDSKNIIFVMAATNRPDLIDPCLTTPGRFDKSVFIGPAKDFESKLRILRPVCSRLQLENGLTIEEIAEMCPDEISGAELNSLMSRAAMNCLREKIQTIEKKQISALKCIESVHSSQVYSDTISDFQKLENANDFKSDENMIITRKHIKMSFRESIEI